MRMTLRPGLKNLAGHRPPPAAALLLLLLVRPPAAAGPAEVPRFNRDIRPILSEKCFPCHGPDSASRKADLRLDQRKAAVEAGAIVPGKPEKSELVRRIFSEREAKRMPPARSKKELSQTQKELLRQWIAAGAEYEPHWSLIPPRRPEPPAVREAAWARNPIDRFILKRLEDHGLAPAPEADPRTLARRLSLDLTGLPPAPEEVERFVKDPSPTGYQELVDRLLASPHAGEHRARYWLDLARYADTHGIHFDNYREMWAYRDWVIDAFNRNLPYDRFSLEQLAGDLLPDRTLEEQVASGFNRSHMTTNEGGAIAEEYLVLYTRDRTETTSQVWLGLTAGCAVCHNHKFDPLTQKGFYELAAFFNNTTQEAMDGNVKDTPPVVPVPRKEDRPRWEAAQRELAGADRALEARRQEARAGFRERLVGAGGLGFAALIPDEGLRLRVPLSEGEGRQARFFLDGQERSAALGGEGAWEAGYVEARAFRSGPGVALEIPSAGDFEKDQPFSCGVWAKAPGNEVSGSIVARLDDGQDFRGWDIWFEKGRLASHLVHKWPEDALKVSGKSKIEAGRWFHVLLTYDGSGQAAGLKLYLDGAPQEQSADMNSLKGSIRTQVPLKAGQRQKGSRIEGLLLQDLRIYGRALSAEEALRLARATRAAWLAARPPAAGSPAEEEIFAAWLSLLDVPHRELQARKDRLAAEISTLRSRGTMAYVQAEKMEPPAAYVLNRGEYDRRRERVTPATPDFLPPMPAELPRNRLGLARWLFLPEQPLTARVAVNRLWQEVFGVGLVRTSGDFGVSGDPPSHPELLDWLAVELRESGWDLRHILKLLVTSAAYRQASAITSEKLEKDPQNRLLSRGPRFRMDAEMVRDYALAASGLLVRKVGGPSVKPYQPEGVWEAVAMMESNTRYYKRDQGDSLYRRSLYTFWKRAAPPASMDILNAPSREVCTVRRERTNTPLQALVTLNDPQFFEAARRLAELVLKEGGAEDQGRLDLLARRVLLRPFRAEEALEARESLAALLSYYRDHPEDVKGVLAVGESRADPALDPALLAAWTLLANEILNLDEVLNK
jgi:hypothetical protein